MRVAMNDAVMAEGIPPCHEHRLGNGVAVLERAIAEGEQRLAIKPRHGEKPLCRKLLDDLRHGDAIFFGEDCSIEARMRGLACIVEFFDKRSEEHTSELQSIMRISYAVFCLKKKKQIKN